MKALTLTQPWATLVAIGAKRIETRSWGTAYRGVLAIHAAKSFPKEARAFTVDPVCYEMVRAYAGRNYLLGVAYPLGVVLAIARLVSVERISKFSRERILLNGGPCERDLGNYSAGRFAWILDSVDSLPYPEPARGALGLWEWNREGLW